MENIVGSHESVNGSKDVAILFKKKKNFGYEIHSVWKDDEGRYILIDTEIFSCG